MADRTAPWLSFAAAAALVAATPALAGGPPSPFELHRELRSHVHDVLRELGRVPERIHARHREHLQTFFGGSSYYAPHRHHHSTYRFPVRVQGVVSYRPYHYCNDVLFGAPGVRLELGYGGGGYPQATYWCDHCRGRYPSRHDHGFRGDGYRYGPDPNWRYSVPYRRPPVYSERYHSRGDHRWCDHDRDRYDRDRYDRRRDDRRDRDDRYDRRRRDDDDRDD